MNKKIALLSSILVLTACKKNPVDRLTNPLIDGQVPQSSGLFIIYDDELKTSGGLGLIPQDGNQSIDLADQSAPHRTVNSIRYTWNGQPVLNNGTPQHLFAGFQLIISPQVSQLATTPARDLSGPGYTRLTMYVRGHLSENTILRVEGPDDGDTATTPARTEISSLSNDWTPLVVLVPAADFTTVKSFVTISLQYTQPPFSTSPGEGGTVYFDEIRYEK